MSTREEDLRAQREACEEIVRIIETTPLKDGIRKVTQVIGTGAAVMEMFAEVVEGLEKLGESGEATLAEGYLHLGDTLDNMLVILQALRRKTKEQVSTFSSKPE